MYTRVRAYAQLNFSSLMQFKTPCLSNVAAPSGLGLPEQFMKIIPYRHGSVGQPNADSPSLSDWRLQVIGDCV